MKHFLKLTLLLFPVLAFALNLEVDLSHLESFYQDLHRHPELSGEEQRTAGKVAAELKTLGLEVIENVGGHGVIGILKNGPGTVTIVRSDTDGLPIQEDTGLKYASQNEGKMHGCGHDFHTASLIGTAQEMIKRKSQWTGTVLFVAQPAEEIGQGAKAILADQKFKKLPKAEQILALHTFGHIKKGTLGVTPGYVMANVDSIDVVFFGRGTHGAMPETGIDPFIMSAEFTLKLQTLLGREKLATEPAVISIGSIHGGTKRNIIPSEVKLQLTVRTYDPSVRELLRRRIREVAYGIAKTAGAPEPRFTLTKEAEATYNDPALTERMAKVFREQLGEEVVVITKPSMAGEDFGLFGRTLKAPSFFFGVGELNEKEPSITNHSPKFAPDFRRTAPLAIQAMVSALLDLHRPKSNL